MVKKLVDIDVELLEEAKRVLGADSYKETVRSGLQEIIAGAAPRREIARFVSTEALDGDCPGVVGGAWR